MRAHYLQHVPFEGLGSIESWLQKAEYEITSTQLFNVAELPEADDIDLLIILGGPMSVNDDHEYPWLAREMRFIKDVVERGKPTLGICLGAQLIAKSMGGEVFPNSEKEIGWFRIQAVETKNNAVYQFPKEIEVFHWHGETFSLPQHAIRIAESKGCRNQAFQIGRNVIGLQFHLETIPGSAKALIENCHDELVEGKYIQGEVDILSTPKERYETINSLMNNILFYLHKSID